jgi:hypothetical protein
MPDLDFSAKTMRIAAESGSTTARGFRMLANMKIIVVLPAYNAAETLKQTYDEIPYDIVDEIILIDDVSKDATVATCAAAPSARSLHCRPYAATYSWARWQMRVCMPG